MRRERQEENRDENRWRRLMFWRDREQREELDHRRRVNALSNHERNLWARAGYPRDRVEDFDVSKVLQRLFGAA